MVNARPALARRKHVSIPWLSRLAYAERELAVGLERAWCSPPVGPGRLEHVRAGGVALCRLVHWETNCEPALTV